MKRQFIEKVKKAIADWAKQYPHVELADVYVYPGGLVDDVHVILMASKGFENWGRSARENDLYCFLRTQLGDADIVKIFFLLALTEEESEFYARLHSTASTGVETFPLALRGSKAQRLFIEKIKKAIADWVKQYPRVELADVYVYPGGFVDDYHVIVVASTGFENWAQSAREDDLYRFLRAQLGDADIVKMFFLLAVTEEESEYYAGLHSTAASGVETFPLALRGSRKQRAFIAKVKTLIQEWAALHPTVELASVEVNPTGLPDDYDVIVVAGKGFENWEKRERENDLYWFLRKKLGDSDIVKIWVLLALTEEQYEKYEITHDAALV